jgi:hypothetical protein
MRATVISAALAFGATQVACGAGDDTTGESAAGRTREPPAQTNETAPSAPRGADGVITLSADEAELTATLLEGEAAQDFLSLLPLELTLSDYRKTEKVGDLPRRLSTEGAPEGHDPRRGDIAYSAPWGNLAIFYRDFGYSHGLVKLGSLESGIGR